MSADAAAILLAHHEQLPPRAAAAATVLRLADDPDTSAQDLARAMGTDPVFAARVLRVANSTYYGLSGRVSTIPFAVSVIGFQAVRSLAVVAAAGLDHPDGAPPGFWKAAAYTATSAELVAGRIEADAGDAFSVGLLHTIGAALLHQHQPLPALCLPETKDVEALLDEESTRYGISHDALGAKVLSAWHFPDHVCELIGRHHEPLSEGAGPLERSLHVARLLAGALLGDDPTTAGTDRTLADEAGWLTEGLIGEHELAELIEQAVGRAESLLEGLVPRR